MKLESPKNMGQVVGGLRCRQSPLRGFIGGVIVCTFLVGASILGRHQGYPWYAWGGCAVLAAVIVPLVSTDVLAKFRATNWLMWLSPDGVWVNLRSHQNHRLPEAPTILYLAYEEIARAHRHIETWSTPGARGGHMSTRWRLEALELHLSSGDAKKIAEALADERGVRAAIKGTHQSVTVPRPGVVRIGWRGHGNDVVPPLARVLKELSRRIEVAKPTRTDRGNWLQMSEGELDELVAHLVRSGDSLVAGALLTRVRGCSATEAHKLVEEQARRV